MTIDESRKPHELSVDSQAGIQLEPDQQANIFEILVDVRVIVFLVSIAVMAMTATVLILSREDETSNQVEVTQHAEMTESSAPLNESNGSTTPNPSEAANAKSAALIRPHVTQAADGSFVLPLQSAVVSGCKIDSKGISSWETGANAQWDLEIKHRRTSFFYCHVTYVAKFEGKFSVQLGGGTPLKFTTYPQEADFIEQFIVRLDAPDQQTIRLIADQVESVAGVTIKQIRLIPR